jgi:hypothetical protein
MVTQGASDLRGGLIGRVVEKIRPHPRLAAREPAHTRLVFGKGSAREPKQFCGLHPLTLCIHMLSFDPERGVFVIEK